MGLHALPDFKPDLVLSGVNDGANMGDDTLYSGTVAAATEADLARHTRRGFFAQRFQRPLLGHRRKAVWMMLEHLLKLPKQPLLWNVNIPAVDAKDIQGCKSPA